MKTYPTLNHSPNPANPSSEAPRMHKAFTNWISAFRPFGLDT